jgi:dihydrolipoamide dehydrogenase
MVSTKVTSMKADDKSVTVNFEGEGAPKEAVYDYVLVSIGRRPNAKIDGLDRTKVKVDAKGFIETDGQRRTAEPTIFAIGDVAGEPMLAHKASHEARVAVEAIEGQKACSNRRPFRQWSSPIRKSRGPASPKPKPRSRG